MDDKTKTKAQLIDELKELRQQIERMEPSKNEQSPPSIQEDRDRLLALVNSISDEIWFADTHRRFTLANLSALREFGLDTADEIAVEKLAESLEVYRSDGTPRPIEESPPLRALKGEVVRNEVQMIRTPIHGESRYRQVSSTPVKDANGNIIGSVSVVRDITELKKTEDALRESEERFRAAFESGAIAMTLTSPDNRLLRVNSALCRMLGFSEAELVGRSFVEITHPDDLELNIRGIQRVVSGETQSFRMEKRYIHKDGRIIWGDMSTALVRNAHGAPLYIVTHIQDITERKQAEQTIRESEHRFRAAIESSPFDFWMIGKDGRYIMQNSTSKQRWGDLIGKRPEDLSIDSHILSKWQGNNRRALAGGTVYGDVNYVIQGEERTFHNIISPILDGETILGILGINIDITERKKMEEALRRSHEELELRVKERTAELNDSNRQLTLEIDVRKQVEEKLTRAMAELARSNTELEQFAYVTSHDLQEPLRMVSSFVQLLAKRYKGKLDQDADDFINYAVDGVTRMQGLIKDILAYSRVGSRGKEFKSISSEVVLAHALSNLKTGIEQSGAVVTRDPLPVVTGDNSQLVQLFQNLIGNAIKFHKEGAPRIHVSAHQQGNEWVFSVADTGIGIAPESFARIFLIFQRLNDRKQYPGIGIGLAICKKVVERHGGEIWAKSEPGMGSTFYFTLPVQRDLIS